VPWGHLVSFIRTVTVGSGLAPGQPPFRGSRTVTASGESHPALKLSPQTIARVDGADEETDATETILGYASKA